MLFGLMVADFALVVALTIPVIVLGFAVGVRFESGVLGVIIFVLISGTWGLVYTGFPYAIAFKTGNPAAVNTSFLLFFPFAFLTTTFLPREAMTGWLAAIAAFNPVTYLLEALRSLLMVGWDPEALLKGLAAVFGVGAVSMTLALLALRGRTLRPLIPPSSHPPSQNPGCRAGPLTLWRIRLWREPSRSVERGRAVPPLPPDESQMRRGLTFA